MVANPRRERRRFCGVSVWTPNAKHPLARLQQTLLVKFSQYAALTVADLTTRKLARERPPGRTAASWGEAILPGAYPRNQ